MSIRGRRVVGFLGEYSAPSLTMPLAGSVYVSGATLDRVSDGRQEPDWELRQPNSAEEGMSHEHRSPLLRRCLAGVARSAR